MESRNILIAVGAVFSVSLAANGQVTFHESLVTSQIDSDIITLAQEGAEPQVSSIADGFHLTGDLTYVATTPIDDMEHPNGLFSVIGVWRRFSTGALPVMVSIGWNLDMKIVNGAILSDTQFKVDVVAGIEIDSNGVPGNDGAVGFADLTPVSETVDPGMFVEVSRNESSMMEVLLPAHSQFFLIGGIAGNICPTDQGGGIEQPADSRFTLEFGGISGYDGLEVTMTWQAVPAPTTVGALGIAFLALVRRRTRA